MTKVESKVTKIARQAGKEAVEVSPRTFVVGNGKPIEEAKAKVEAQKPTKTSPPKKKDKDPRKTVELRALLKRRGVKLTQVMKKSELIEIADHPKRAENICNMVSLRWKKYVRELQAKKEAVLMPTISKKEK